MVIATRPDQQVKIGPTQLATIHRSQNRNYQIVTRQKSGFLNNTFAPIRHPRRVRLLHSPLPTQALDLVPRQEPGNDYLEALPPSSANRGTSRSRSQVEPGND